MNIRDRVLALLSERPMSQRQLLKALSLKPSQAEQLSRELTLLNRERQIRMQIGGGGWEVMPKSDGETEAPVFVQPARKQTKRGEGSNQGRPLTARSQAIVDAVADGPKTAAEIVALVGEADQPTYNRLSDLVKRGHIARLGYGKYAQADAMVMQYVDHEPPAAPPAVATAVQAAHTVQISTCGIDPDASPEMMTALHEVAERFIATRDRAVDHPPHYEHASGVECIDVVETMSFNVGNAVKYLWRADHKGVPIQDLEKARWYIEREIVRLRGNAN